MGIKISIADVLATFGEVSLWRIEDMFEDNIRTQMNKAIFTTIHEIDVRGVSGFGGGGGGASVCVRALGRLS